VFARGDNDALWHIWQTRPGGDWSGWASLGGPLQFGPAVGTNADGRLEVFVTGVAFVAHNWQTVPNGGWSGWSVFGNPQ